MATTLPLDDRLDIAAQLAKRARIFYDIWWFYEGVDTRPLILDTMKRYSEFFRFDTHAHFVSMVIHLAGLFEGRKGTINLGALIKEAETSGVSREAIDKAKALMAEAAGLPPKVGILRSNLFAHRSASLSYAGAFQKADLKPDQLRDLAAVALRIANTLLIARGRDEQFFHELPRRNVERMLNDLPKANAS